MHFGWQNATKLPANRPKNRSWRGPGGVLGGLGGLLAAKTETQLGGAFFGTLLGRFGGHILGGSGVQDGAKIKKKRV